MTKYTALHHGVGGDEVEANHHLRLSEILTRVTPLA